MQYDPKDLQIFVTGVVGRAMGSGKFDAAAIGTLTQAAVETFLHEIAPKLAQAPRPAPSASQGLPGASQPPRPDWQGGAAALGAPVGPESAPFNMWGGEAARFGRKDAVWRGKPQRDVAWYEWVDAAIDGDQDARRALDIMAKSDPTKGDPKFLKSNVRQKSRALACQKLVAEGKRTTAKVPEQDEAELSGEEPPW